MWPHELQTQIAVGLKNDSGIRSRCSSENENLDTRKLMEKIEDVHLVSDSENEAPSKMSLPISKAEMEVNAELDLWRKKQALKKSIERKLKSTDISFSSSSSSSSDEDVIRTLDPKPIVSSMHKGVQISATPKQLTRYKKYTRKRVDKRPPWVKYWKHGNKYQMRLPTVSFSDGARMVPAGVTSGQGEVDFYNNREHKTDAAGIRRIHERVANEERRKVQLQKNRERRVLDRLQNDLAREIGEAPRVFSVKRVNAETTTSESKVYRNKGTETMREAPTKFSIGNQTFKENTVAVQVD